MLKKSGRPDEFWRGWFPVTLRHAIRYPAPLEGAFCAWPQAAGRALLFASRSINPQVDDTSLPRSCRYPGPKTTVKLNSRIDHAPIPGRPATRCGQVTGLLAQTPPEGFQAPRARHVQKRCERPFGPSRACRSMTHFDVPPAHRESVTKVRIFAKGVHSGDAGPRCHRPASGCLTNGALRDRLDGGGVRRLAHPVQ